MHSDTFLNCKHPLEEASIEHLCQRRYLSNFTHAATSSLQEWLRLVDILLSDIIGEHEQWFPHFLRPHLYHVYAKTRISSKLS
jgi:hypothetical protein